MTFQGRFVLAAALAFASFGCNNPVPSIIDHVTFQPSDNLEVVQVAVVFASAIKSDFADEMTIGNYGYLFIDPFTTNQPFEVGFDLNTSIFNEQSYVGIAPTEVLPNGVPIGLPNAVVQLNDPKPISSQFDLYGYVDVLKTSWLGVAAMFQVIDQYFPAGLTVSQVFMRDSAGDPGIIADAFGPVLNADGTVQKAGGVALFANIRQLIANGTLVAGKKTEFRPEPGLKLSGPAAASYEGRIAKLLELQKRFVERLNSN
jgi:hypothetical protein